MKSQYKDTKFKTEDEFLKFLHRKTEIRITFEDNGQDCLEWFIDTRGEVLHSDMQSAVWNGKMVDLTKLKIGKEIPLQDGSFITFVVKNIYQFPFKKIKI